MLVQARLTRILDAVENQDRNEFDEAMRDLWVWLTNEGRSPVVNVLGYCRHSNGELLTLTSYPHRLSIQSVNRFDAEKGFQMVKWSPDGNTRRCIDLLCIG
jgi:hypothetical protein